MGKTFTQKTAALARYIHAREEKEDIENIFLEPIAETGTSDDEVMFNLVTVLLSNGFTPYREVQEWYARQKSMRG